MIFTTLNIQNENNQGVDIMNRVVSLVHKL